MANNWYDAGRKYELDGLLNPAVDTIKACLVKSTYVPDLTNHAHLADLGTNRIGTDQTIVVTTTAAGTLKAQNSVFPSTPGGSQINYVAIYKLVGDGSSGDVTSPLLLLWDTVAGFPVTSGVPVTIFWGQGSVPSIPGATVRV